MAKKPKPKSASKTKKSQSAQAEEIKAKALAEPGPGHNSGEKQDGLTDEQKQVLWFQRKGKILSLRDSLASFTADIRNEFKGLKADLGIKKADFDFIVAAINEKDGEVTDSHRRRIAALKWEGHALGTQPDLFDGVDRTPLVDRAFSEGRVGGMEGVVCKPPYEGAGEQEWIAGWHEGQAAIARSGIKAPLTPLEEAAAGDDFDALVDAEAEREEETVGLQ
jgi:hypothetical protein